MRRELFIGCAWLALIFGLFTLSAPSDAVAAHGRRPRPHRRHRPILLQYAVIASRAPHWLITPQSQLILPTADHGAQPRSFYEEHAARVRRAMIYFQVVRSSQLPMISPPPPPATDTGQSVPFFRPSPSQDALNELREIERLRLWNAPDGNRGVAVASGVGLFVTTVFATAHAPPPLRLLFDGPLHLGPVIFQGGGMGAGVEGVVF